MQDSDLLKKRTRIDFVLPKQFKSKTEKPLQSLDNKNTMLKQLKILLSEFQAGSDGKLIKAQIRSLLKTILGTYHYS